MSVYWTVKDKSVVSKVLLAVLCYIESNVALVQFADAVD